MRRALLALITLTAAGCAELSIETRFDPEVDWTGRQSYAWAELEASSGDEAGDAPELVTTLRAAANTVFATRLLVLDQQDPHVLVGVSAALGRGFTHAQLLERYGFQPGWLEADGEQPAHSLIVDVADAETRALLWRGVAHQEGLFDGLDEDRLTRTVQRILATFPPGLAPPAH